MVKVEPAPSSSGPQSRVVFLSYSHLDDDPPPEYPEGGYVRYFWTQLRWELNRLGVPDAVLWRDRGQIARGDIFDETIMDALNTSDLFVALLSRNYARRPWCQREVSTMASRVALLDATSRQRRIFRADKQHVREDDIPEPLRRIQSVRFYDIDQETKIEQEYFWRGKVQRYEAYVDAVKELAWAIYQRLMEIGVEMTAPAPVIQAAAVPSNGRTIYVAKPARDVVEEYKALTRDLIQHGYRVVPDKDSDLSSVGEEAVATIDSALAEAELSIHLLGTRTGGRPDGLQADIVPLQLAAAASQTEKRADFYRLIWAPKILPNRNPEDKGIELRDPFEVLANFDRRMQSDQIDSDTSARFGEFVLQRLEGAQPDQASSVYIHCAPDDRMFALQVARQIKSLGYSPLLRPAESEGIDPAQLKNAEMTLVGLADRAILCWGKSSQLALLRELSDDTLTALKAKSGHKRGFALIIGPPDNDAKRETVEIGIGPDVELLIDATNADSLTSEIAGKLVPWLRSPH